MKRITKRIISGLLALFTLLPSAISAAPATKTEEAKNIDIFSVDLSSGLTMSGSYMQLADFEKEIAAGTIAAGTNGSYKFTKAPDGTKALELSYSEMKGQPSFRCMPYMTDGKPGADYKYMRVEYMTDNPSPASMFILNNAVGTDRAVLIEDTSVSKGEWIATPTACIDVGELMSRITSGRHFTIGVDSANDTAKYYVRRINFFKSADDAYAYYGDCEDDYVQTVYPLTLAGSDVTGNPLNTNELWGKYDINHADGTVDIHYAPETNFGGINYMLKLNFKSKAYIVPEAKWARILYSAKNPAGASGGSLILRNDAADERAILVDNLTDTDGFVLSDTVEIPQGIMERFSATGKYTSCMHNTLKIKGVNVDGGEYRIKAIYFFTSKEKADAYKLPSEEPTTVSIAGNDISTYAIVTPNEDINVITEAANKLAVYIEDITGIKLPIYKGSCPDTYNMLLIGKTDIAASADAIKDIGDSETAYKRYVIKLEGNDIVINSPLPAATKEGVDIFINSFLGGSAEKPEKNIEITKLDSWGVSGFASYYGAWSEIQNSALPYVFTEDFDCDERYFNNVGTNSFVIQNGVMTAKATTDALAYIHVYEQNAEVKATFMQDALSEGADFGFMLRYTADDAYIKAGYSAKEGKFYITSREGMDFYSDITLGEKFTPEIGKAYTLEFSVDGSEAELKLDGKTVCLAEGITHVTPGRPAIFANNVRITVDDFELTLTSGEGVIWQDVTHTRLPGDEYMEGGTVIEMNDGRLTYTHHSGTTYVSNNGGITWNKAERFAQSFGYTNILRLSNGELMQIATVTQNGVNYWCSRTSADEGKTWVNGGIICNTHYNGQAGVSAGNMNDKLTQSATTGRIFYSQNYEVKSGYNRVNGNSVFCEFYYSDDNGKTWTKSDTDSWEIEGNDDPAFGECKILECADGTLRVYSSWNGYDCVVYSESADNGKTWGPISIMPELPCSRSSMQFVRDVYAENNTTYYMVWVNTQNNELVGNMPRNTISLAKTTDGKNWVYLGDVWRWQFNYNNEDGYMNVHAVDPFINVTKNRIIVGSGLSEHFPTVGTNGGHGSQRQHIWSIAKDTLPEGTPVKAYGTLYSFTDVKTTDYFYDAVKFAVDNGLFNGTSATTFDPEVTMNRAMFVTVLARLEGENVDNNTKTEFTDVKVGEWYTGSVAWAAKNGIVNGMGNGIYGVTNTITVEQACTILYRYATSKDNTVGTGVPDCPSITYFTDSASVSSWAKDGVKWAVENGIYQGANGKLAPSAAASRALVATMFANYVKVSG